MNKIKILNSKFMFSLIVANLPAVNNTQYNTFKITENLLYQQNLLKKKDILNTLMKMILLIIINKIQLKLIQI